MITPIASGYMIIESTVSERPVTWVQVHRILNSNDFVVLNSLVDDIMESHHQSEVFVSMYKAQVDYSKDEVAE